MICSKKYYMGIDTSNGKVFSMAIVDEDGYIECMIQLKDLPTFNETVKTVKSIWPIEMTYPFLTPEQKTST